MALQTLRRVTSPACLLSADERAEIRDNLTLALDTLECGPLDHMGLWHLLAYQRAALKVLHMKPGVQ